MQQDVFTNILQNPQVISHVETEAIKSVINQFPYFQPARAIRLKGLKDQSSISYNQELKVTAAYTTDRSILFDFITSEAFIEDRISNITEQKIIHTNAISATIQNISINKNTTFDDTLKQQIKDTDGVLDPSLFQRKEILPEPMLPVSLQETKPNEDLTKKTKTEEASAENVLKLGEPLQFDKKETHSFNEWLKLSHSKPIERETNYNKEIPAVNKTTERLEKEKKFKLIDKFISTNPKIKPNKTNPQKINLANAQMIQPESLMTETLARIYVEQKNYKKAIQSYKILSLKYPEKSSFFANQIEAVEHLKEQNN